MLPLLLLLLLLLLNHQLEEGEMVVVQMAMVIR